MSVASEVFQLFDSMVRAELADTSGDAQVSEDIIEGTKAVWPEVLAELLFVPASEHEQAPHSMLELAQRLVPLVPEVSVDLPKDAGEGVFVVVEPMAQNFDDGFDEEGAA